MIEQTAQTPVSVVPSQTPPGAQAGTANSNIEQSTIPAPPPSIPLTCSNGSLDFLTMESGLLQDDREVVGNVGIDLTEGLPGSRIDGSGKDQNGVVNNSIRLAVSFFIEAQLADAGNRGIELTPGSASTGEVLAITVETSRRLEWTVISSGNTFGNLAPSHPGDRSSVWFRFEHTTEGVVSDEVQIGRDFAVVVDLNVKGRGEFGLTFIGESGSASLPVGFRLGRGVATISAAGNTRDFEYQYQAYHIQIKRHGKHLLVTFGNRDNVLSVDTNGLHNFGRMELDLINTTDALEFVTPISLR